MQDDTTLLERLHRIETEFWEELAKSETAFTEKLRHAKDEYEQRRALEIHRIENPTE